MTTETTRKPTTAVQTYKVGNIVKFGEYDWQVLDVQDGKALLITKNIIEQLAYNTEYADVTWAICSLRSYLNGTFYNSFSSTDRARIASTTLSNPDNPWSGNDGGNDTQDKIFLLSFEELFRYFGNGNVPSQPAFPYTDDYDNFRIAKFDNSASRWWLRSPGLDPYIAAGVDGDGIVDLIGRTVYDSSSGVRPALWLNLES
ncbi:MAG: DUF6273 domain-containing protein [Oscillospiraceae bacterium]|jgi:hypothetical protein|nr:DUF6273 domain-containing protein [Oscillospiraceae bacterium]